MDSLEVSLVEANPQQWSYQVALHPELLHLEQTGVGGGHPGGEDNYLTVIAITTERHPDGRRLRLVASPWRRGAPAANPAEFSPARAVFSGDHRCDLSSGIHGQWAQSMGRQIPPRVGYLATVEEEAK
ncbi:unnamed protein product [Lampetra fluviatilis]